jgi:hypothetical protein
LIVLQYFDWFGSPESLKKWDEETKRVCGLSKDKFMGRYGAAQKKYHWCYVYEVSDYTKWNDNFTKNFKIKRDLDVMRYFELEMLVGPAE